MDNFQKWFMEHDSDFLVPDMDTDDYELAAEGFREFRKRVRKEKEQSRPALRWMERIAAALLIPVAITSAALLSRKQAPIQWEEVYTAAGQTRTVTLADGSTLRLSPESRLIYPSSFKGEVRKVFLEGEAYADITHMEEFPFEIHCNEIKVKVLGTEFNFTSYPSDKECELALVDGAVEMSIEGKDSGHTIKMKTGEMVRYEKKTGYIEKQRFSVDAYMNNLYRDGLQFSNRRMDDIVNCLERKFGVNIAILDHSINNDRFFASFINGEDLPTILDALNTENHMKITRKGEDYYLSLKK